MNIFTKARLLAHVLHWRITWDKRDTRKAVTVPGNPKFMGVRDAVKLIKDGAVMGTSGLAGNQRASYMWWGMREMFQETGHPKDLTIVSVGGQGGRGKIPGTLEELACPGLCTRFFTGHTETYKGILKLADKGLLELQCIPQGTLALILKAMGNGQNFVVNETGAGTFMDPRTGRGTPVLGGDAPQYVSVEDGKFKYTCPKIDVAVFNAPAADRKGNIYVKNCAIIGESYEIAKAAKKNGGIVIVNVAKIVEEGYGEVFLPAEEVDAIVVWRDTEQSASIKHRKYWEFLALNSKVPINEGIARARVINNILGITPRRTPADDVLARLAASIFVENARKGDYVDIGVGLPEEASRLLFESGAMKDITLLNESGVFGGLPAPGIFFGAAVNPEEIVSSSTAFERVYNRLDAVILGALQVDSEGNVNVSKRGEGAINYVGPGGFIDLTTCANLVMFCASWGDRADIRIENGRLNVAHPGKPKFLDCVDEITFSGKEALKAGKRVFYVTHLGAFQLTQRGMELIRVMPGIDVQKDIAGALKMKVVLPDNGDVPVVDSSIVTGKGFKLAFHD